MSDFILNGPDIYPEQEERGFLPPPLAGGHMLQVCDYYNSIHEAAFLLFSYC